MVSKVLLVASFLVSALAQPAADKYPAGVDPALCPNYPHCDNVLLAHGQQNAGFGGGYGGNYGGSYNNFGGGFGGAYHTPASTFYGGYSGFSGHGAYAAPGYPAGVDPSSCPNYPYCSNLGSSSYHVAPLPGFAHRQYPDGVNPNTCPNYPYCH